MELSLTLSHILSIFIPYSWESRGRHRQTHSTRTIKKKKKKKKDWKQGLELPSHYQQFGNKNDRKRTPKTTRYVNELDLLPSQVGLPPTGGFFAGAGEASRCAAGGFVVVSATLALGVVVLLPPWTPDGTSCTKSYAFGGSSPATISGGRTWDACRRWRDMG